MPDLDLRAQRVDRLRQNEDLLQSLVNDYLDLYSTLLSLDGESDASADARKSRVAAAAARTAEGTLGLAGLYVSNGRLDEAFALYSRPILLRAKPRDAALGRVVVRFRQERLDEAFQEGEELLRLGFDSSKQIERLSYPFGERGHTAAERRVLERLLEGLDASASPWAALYRVTLTIALKRDVAEPDLRRLSQAARGRYEWMRWLVGSRALARGRWDEAATELIAAVRRQPRFIRAGFLIGEALLGKGRVREALKVFERFKPAERDAAWGQWLAWMGEIHLRLGRDVEAQRFLDQACARGDESPRAYCWRGAVRLRSGRAREALPDFDTSIRIDPTDEEPYLWRAEAYGLLDEHRRSMDDLGAVLAKRPGHLVALAMRARVRWKLGDAAGMRRDAAEMGAALGPSRRLSDPNLLRRLDAFLARDGERLKAVQYFQAARTKSAWRRLAKTAR